MSKYSKESSTKRGYNYKWQKARKVYLIENPLCVFCSNREEIKAADVVDHIQPHKGDDKLFWDAGNWQPLCKQCHDSTKQRIESKGYSNEVGDDGFPIDPKHPVNR